MTTKYERMLKNKALSIRPSDAYVEDLVKIIETTHTLNLANEIAGYVKRKVTEAVDDFVEFDSHCACGLPLPSHDAINCTYCNAIAYEKTNCKHTDPCCPHAHTIASLALARDARLNVKNMGLAHKREKREAEINN